MADKRDDPLEDDCLKKTVAEEQNPLSATAALHVDTLGQRNERKQQRLSDVANDGIEVS
jgi:hypothetical protein